MTKADMVYERRCGRLVSDFFGKSSDNDHLWFSIKNPLLGNVTPYEYARIRGWKRLHRFIENQLSENEAPQRR